MYYTNKTDDLRVCPVTEWRYQKLTNADTLTQNTVAQCVKCNVIYSYNKLIKGFNYCPNCGAKINKR